jgi:hypothetical protein
VSIATSGCIIAVRRDYKMSVDPESATFEVDGSNAKISSDGESLRPMESLYGLTSLVPTAY